MAKAKVLRIITRLNIGGPAIHTVLLTEGLNKKRFSPLLICGNVNHDEGDMSYYARQEGISPLYIPQLRRELNPINDLITFLKILRIIKAEKPNIIHTHTAKAGALGMIAGIVYTVGMRLLHPAPPLAAGCGARTFHGHIFKGYFNKSLSRVFVFIEKFLTYFTSRIITVSESVKNELIRLGICKEDKIKVIHLGFELDKFLNINADKRVCSGGGGGFSSLNVGIVGRLVPINNHRLFLDAVSIVMKENPRLNVLFKINKL